MMMPFYIFLSEEMLKLKMQLKDKTEEEDELKKQIKTKEGIIMH